MRQPTKNGTAGAKSSVKAGGRGKGRAQRRQAYGTSKLEKYFAETFLDKSGLPYVYEYEAKDIGRFYDFAIVATLPGSEVLYEDRQGVRSVNDKAQYTRVQAIIEVDGDYYHANPDKVGASRLSPMQKRNRTVDRLKDTWCQKHHIPIFRIWESDIRNNPAKVLSIISDIAETCGRESRMRAARSNPRRAPR